MASSLAVTIECVRVFDLIIFENAYHRIRVGWLGSGGIKATFVILISDVHALLLAVRSVLGVVRDNTVNVATRNARWHVRRCGIEGRACRNFVDLVGVNMRMF